MFRQRTLQQVSRNRGALAGRRAFVGFDGFVDTIVTPVGLRRASGDAFTPIATLTELGQRIVAAAGKSTNIELYPRLDKLGGNGPIMANALLGTGLGVTYAGALSSPVHPVFADLARRARTYPLCAAASTTAVELQDGKLMLGMMRSLDEITFARIREVIGDARLDEEIGGAQLLAFVNWTMIPHMTAIFNALADEVLPRLPAVPDRVFFFDLADPEKRSADDLRGALTALARFGRFGRVVLGLNLKEAQQVAAALGLAQPERDEASLRAAAAAIRGKLGVATVVIHPTESAACATEAGTAWVPGPFTDRPLITTGAGDHFNAGFASGAVMGLDPEGCLTLGVATSGHYVRTGESPTLAQLETFLANWR
jgi:hypothetical protein